MNASMLGREFLTWLWFKSEERNGTIMVPQSGDIELIFLKKVVFESGEGEYLETIACQGFQTDLKEGKKALEQGKKIKEARLSLQIGSDQWEFTFKADQFQFQSLKLPVQPDDFEIDEDQEGKILERIYLTEKVLETMDRLFSLFLDRRLSAEWLTEEIPRMKTWITK